MLRVCVSEIGGWGGPYWGLCADITEGVANAAQAAAADRE